MSCSGSSALNRQGGFRISRSRNDFETPSNTGSKGFVIPTSTDTAFFAANPLRSRRIFDRCQLHRVGDVGIGSHIQKLAGETIRSHFQT